MSGAVGETLFQLGYQVSPIIMSGGIATNIPGSLLPIVALTQSISFATGLLNGSNVLNLDSFFAQFKPLPGSTLIDDEFGEYPFANLTVAANAAIANPLTLSMLMICPAQGTGGYISKLATLTALSFALRQHRNLGGSYVVATPALIYPNMLLKKVFDVSEGGDSKQVQTAYQWDFYAPLITQQQAHAAQSTLTQKLTSMLPTDGSLSGATAGIGSSLAGLTSSIMSAAQNLAGAAVGGVSSIGSSLESLL